jgi:hypothetical protein
MPTVRLPLVFPIQSRKADPLKDAKMVNAYKEDDQVLKRPGLLGVTTTPALPTGVGQGVFGYLNSLISCTNNAIYKTESGVATSLGSISGAVKPISWTSTFNNNYLFFHNQSKGYVYSTAGGLDQITNDSVVEVTMTLPGSGYTSVPSVTFSAPPSGTTATGTAELATPVTTVLTTVAITGTAGQFSCAATSLYVGQLLTISGVFGGTGSITGYTNPKTYKVSATNGTTTFTLVTTAGAAIVTTAGTPTGLTYTLLDTSSVANINIVLKGSGYVTAPTVTIGQSWVASTALTLGTQIFYSGYLYTVTAAGTTGTSGPSHTSGSQTNGTTTLAFAGIAASATCALNYFPDTLVPGVAYLDTYVVVMTPEGRLYNSNSADPTAWNALNYISSNSQPDTATGVTSHLNYVVAFNQWSTQFFYDSGASTGSPLLSNSSANLEIGCANGNSIAKFEQTVAWVGQSNTAGKGVYLLNGIAPVKISNQYIDKYLDTDTCANCSGFGIKFNGHSWYVLTLPDSDITLVYDIDEKIWTFWSSVVANEEIYFVGDFATSLGGHTYMQDSVAGELYKLDHNYFTDQDGVINFRLVSPLIDADTQFRKTVIRVEMIGDKVNTVLRIRHTDNDYQNWSMYRSVNLSDSRPVLYQNGVTRRRAYEMFNNDNTFIRLSAMEMDVTVGDN